VDFYGFNLFFKKRNKEHRDTKSTRMIRKPVKELKIYQSEKNIFKNFIAEPSTGDSHL
jgi:hypothetical protein